MRASVCLAAITATLVPASAHAHFLWAYLTPEEKTLSIGLQESPTDSPLPLGERSPKVKAWTTTEKSLPLALSGDVLKTSTAAHCVGVSLDYGVLDRTDQGRGIYWLRYYAKAADSDEASQTKVDLPVDVAYAVSEGRPTVTVFNNGKPAAGAEVVVPGEGESELFSGSTLR